MTESNKVTSDLAIGKSWTSSRSFIWQFSQLAKYL